MAALRGIRVVYGRRMAVAMLCLVLLIPVMMTGWVNPRQGVTSNEYQLKAVFLLNFTRFIEWPEDAFVNDKAPLVIGVLGKNPFGTYLAQTVRGEIMNGHPLIVKQYNKADDIDNCHIVFVNIQNSNWLTDALTTLKGMKILTVGDNRAFIQQGGMIQFVTRENKIRILIKPDAAKAADLNISSKLLRLAEIVN